MSKTPWREVEAGDVVELKGKPWTVDAVKHKKKRSRVTVSGPGGTFTRDVDPADKVKLKPLRKDGQMQRWAKPSEVAGAAWAQPAADEAGRNVERILGGQLVAVKPEGSSLYAVPPVDITTVRAHLQLFHAMPGDVQPEEDAACLVAHAAEHEHRRPAIAHEHTKAQP